VLDDGIRRLEVQARDLDFLSGLPLKFLVLIGPHRTSSHCSGMV
jgi:hypothetical protein